LRRVQAGDAAAVADVAARLTPRVRGLAAVRMGRALVDVVDSDDIVQEAMLAVMAHLDRFEARSEGELVCWLATIVESRIHNAARAARADKRGRGQVQRRADLGITTLSQLGPAAAAPSPSAELAAGELDADLERALLALGDPQRQIVYCRLVLDMSFAEIAAALPLKNADVARATFHKALERLRARLSPPAREPGNT
jgi:RNA polymerase sigma-70 factor (ECF subfamily)